MEPHTRKAIHHSLPIPRVYKKNLPEKYEKIGDILIIHLDPCLHPYKRDIGKAYKKAFNVKTVCMKGRIYSEFRIPRFEVIAGSDTVTVHKENTILYKLDLSRVMFSTGNIHERIRMSTLPHYETVVDMFAGIGYFTLPIAKFCRSNVAALEKNEDAYDFLCENIALNKVQNLVTPYLTDCNDFKGKAERVIMGHPHAYRYLDKAFEICEKGIIHYHAFAPEAASEKAHTWLNCAAEKAERTISIKNRRTIKKFSPGVWHIVYDVEVF